MSYTYNNPTRNIAAIEILSDRGSCGSETIWECEQALAPCLPDGQHCDQIRNGAGDQYSKVQHLRGSALLRLDRSAHIFLEREDPVVPTDSHKCCEKAESPQSYDSYPGKDKWPEPWNIEDLEVEKRYGDLYRPSGKNPCHNKGVVVLKN